MLDPKEVMQSTHWLHFDDLERLKVKVTNHNALISSILETVRGDVGLNRGTVGFDLGVGRP